MEKKKLIISSQYIWEELKLFQIKIKKELKLFFEIVFLELQGPRC